MDFGSDLMLRRRTCSLFLDWLKGNKKNAAPMKMIKMKTYFIRNTLKRTKGNS